MSPYVEEVAKDIRAAQEKMVLLSMAGFKELYDQYQEALNIVLAEQKAREAQKVEEPKAAITEPVVEKPVKKVVRKKK